MGRLTKKQRVKFNNTRRRVHVYENTELSPVRKGDIFDRMLAKTNVATIYKPPAGPYPKSLRSKVAKSAKSRLALRHRLARLSERLSRMPEHENVDSASLFSRTRR
jgi:hypothetical protein